jgi:hypothetical protein
VIQLRDPLRQLGEFEIGIRVAQGVEPKIKVKIVSAESLSEEQESQEPSRPVTSVESVEDTAEPIPEPE